MNIKPNRTVFPFPIPFHSIVLYPNSNYSTSGCRIRKVKVIRRKYTGRESENDNRETYKIGSKSSSGIESFLANSFVPDSNFVSQQIPTNEWFWIKEARQKGRLIVLSCLC